MWLIDASETQRERERAWNKITLCTSSSRHSLRKMHKKDIAYDYVLKTGL